LAWSEHAFETAFLASEVPATALGVGDGCAIVALEPIRTTNAHNIKVFEGVIVISPKSAPHQRRAHYSGSLLLPLCPHRTMTAIVFIHNAMSNLVAQMLGVHRPKAIRELEQADLIRYVGSSERCRAPQDLAERSQLKIVMLVRKFE
jgi:hypothetical protein